MSIRDAKILKIVPNSLTIGNSLCGFIAILYTLRAYDASRDFSAMLHTFSGYGEQAEVRFRSGTDPVGGGFPFFFFQESSHLRTRRPRATPN